MFTTDDFLGGKVRLQQDKTGLRATSDSVLVAAVVPAQAGDTILDVGTGNGVIAMCLNARIPNLKITGLDCQSTLLDLACKNAQTNSCDFTPVLANIDQRPSPIHGKQYHHVVSNPPFYDEPHLRHNSQTAKAYHQSLPLKIWLDFCLRHIRAKGSLTLIQRPEALPEILSALDGRLGSIEVIPIQSKSGEPAKRIIIRGRMNSRKALTLFPPLIMHTQQGERTKTAETLLRKGQAFDDISS